MFSIWIKQLQGFINNPQPDKLWKTMAERIPLINSMEFQGFPGRKRSE